MPPLTSQNELRLSRRSARVFAALALMLPMVTACERLAGTNKANIEMVQRHFDSLALADTNLLQRTASQDSLFAIREVQRRTDSILRLTSPDLAPPVPKPDAVSPPSTPGTTVPGAAVATATPSTLPSAPRGTAPGATTATARPVSTPEKPGVETQVQRQLSRAQALGDSIANAKVDKLVGQNRSTTAADTVRGVIQLSGTPPADRPVLMADGGRTTVALTGMGIDGLAPLAGAEVTVRGMRVSPRDLVVSAFTVRAVKGYAVLDGWLRKAERGGWNIELSDKSGIRQLPSLPDALQMAVGARIWIDVNNGTRPQTYGVIARH